jgi:hypothetical protein
LAGWPGGLKWSLIEVGEAVHTLPKEVSRLRWLRYIMLALALAGAIGAFAYRRAAVAREQMLVDSARDTVLAIEQKVRYLKALEELELNDFGWPDVVDPRWFSGGAPRNAMLDARHPWLEVASTLEYTLDHPVQRVAINEQLAGLWYNPAKGIVRARVPQTVSDEKTMELYNRINGASITELFDSSPRRRILETLREAELPEEFEPEPPTGVRIRRPGDDDREDKGAGAGDGLPEGDAAESDEGGPVPDDEADDPAGPVPVDPPPADEGAPVREDGAGGGESRE